MNVSPIALQFITGFYMECQTGLKLVKREYSLPQITSVCQIVSKEISLTGPKDQAKIPSYSGYCVLGEGQLYPLPLIMES